MRNIKYAYLLFLAFFFRADAASSHNLVLNGGFENHLPFDFSVYLPNASAAHITNWKEHNDWVAAYCHKEIIRRYGYEGMNRVSFYKFDTTYLSDQTHLVVAKVG